VAPALPCITSYLHSTPPAVLHLPPDPLTGKALLQDDLRNHPTQGGPGVQDRAVEPQHRRDHLQLNPHWRSDLPGAQDMLSCASPRPRASTTAGPGATCAPRTMKLTGNNSEMLRHYVGNRKKGHIFINERTGKRLTLRHFEKMIDKWARLLNIQKLQSIKPSGREYHLITLMGLREAGERHHDLPWRLMCLRRRQDTARRRRRGIIRK